jgi:FkbM family methyltransferase
MKMFLKLTADKIFNRIGLAIVRSSDNRNRSTMTNVLRVLKAHTKINTIIDIGASDGRWSLEAKGFFKEQAFHLVEGNPLHEASIIKNRSKLNNATYTLKVASSNLTDIYFDDSDLFGGVASKSSVENTKLSKATTIDFDVQENKLKGPFLIKFDTHGFEKEILMGASDTLNETNAIIMECYNFHLTDNSLLFNEMIDFLSKKNFRVADIVNQLYRPSDNFLWQIDILFLRNDRKEFSNNKYN